MSIAQTDKYFKSLIHSTMGNFFCVPQELGMSILQRISHSKSYNFVEFVTLLTWTVTKFRSTFSQILISLTSFLLMMDGF